MAFIRSLFCFSGQDNALRFTLISLSSYLFLALVQAVFIDFWLIQVILALIILVILGIATVRRCHDAVVKRTFILVPVLLFLLAAILVIFTDNNLRYLAILPGLIVASLNFLWPSAESNQYILGYAGPVDLSQYLHQHGQQHRQQRVEPSLFTVDNLQTEETATASRPQGAELYRQTQAQANMPVSSATKKALDLSQWRKPLLISSGVLSTALVVVIIFVMSTDKQNEDVTENIQANEQNTPTNEYVHELPMPDNFTLMMDNHQGVTIYWQADEVGIGEIWSIKTAQGDNSCSIIDFDRGKSIRSIEVVAKSGGDYYAQFSPLDTAALIKNIAGRNRFKLCGYAFSLKGSQAKLTYDSVFEPYL